MNNKYMRGRHSNDNVLPKKRFPWTDEHIKYLEECKTSLNLNDGVNFSEKEFIASLVLDYANGAMITERQAGTLAKIYKRRVLCISERPHE